jgi:hypothetical protein
MTSNTLPSPRPSLRQGGGQPKSEGIGIDGEDFPIGHWRIFRERFGAGPLFYPPTCDALGVAVTGVTGLCRGIRAIFHRRERSFIAGLTSFIGSNDVICCTRQCARRYYEQCAKGCLGALLN